MRDREVRDWISETRGTRFELVRHFLPRFFDSDLVASSADWTRVAVGVVSMLASSWFLLAAVLLFKYKKLAAMGLMSRFEAEARADVASVTGMAVCVTVLLAAVLWQSVYPTLRDCLALAAMPASPADIFIGKFAAVVIAFAVFVVLLDVPCGIVLGAFTRTPITTTLGMLIGGSTVAFFGLIALQGVLLNLLPARLFERAMIWLQAALTAAALGGFPFMAWKGREVLGGVRLSGRDLLLALTVPPALALLAYAFSFHRHRKLLLEAPRPAPPRRFDLLSRILDLFIHDPREQAAFAFIWQTIRRSRIHRLAVLVYIGLAAAWVMKSAVDALSQQTPRSEMDRLLFTSYPLALVLFTLLGFRHLFSLPAELRANWIFQVTEREGRRGWLNAMERFVMGCGVAPVVALGAAFVWRNSGPFVAIGWAAIAYLLASIVFEHLFKRWRKLPFTCTYLPGKRPIVFTLGLFLGLMPLVLPVALIVYLCASNPASFLILASLEVGVWTYMRRQRMKTWGIAPLRYVEEWDPEIDSFGFSAEGTTLAQEEFQREWSDYLRSGPDVPILSALDAGETRAERVWQWMKAIPQDLRYSLRVIVKSPGFALTVVATLGLGLGLNAAFFSIFNAFLLKPLAVRDPASLVSIEFETRYRTRAHLNFEDYNAFAKAAVSAAARSGSRAAVTEIAASTLHPVGIDGRAGRVAVVSTNYFSMLGVGAAMGRVLAADDREPVIVLSHRAWQGRFGADPNIVGRKVQVNGMQFEAVGVTPPRFAGVNVGTIAVMPPEISRLGVGSPDAWIPIEFWNSLPKLERLPVLGVIGRLGASVTTGQAETPVSGWARAVTAARAQYDRVARAKLETLDIPITWTALEFSLPLLLAFALTMVIPCANAANMMLARVMARQRELGTRLSLGASRGRVVRQLLTESVVLALAAGVAGLALARVSLDAFSRLIYATAPPTVLFKFRLPDLTIDNHVFVYMLLVAGLTPVLFALVPAAQATRVALTYALRGEFGAFRASRLRDALVVGQIAGCAMLLVMAAILVRGAGRSAAVERGYEARGVFAALNQSPEDARALASILEHEPWVEAQAVMGSPFNEMDSILASNPARSGSHSVYYHYGSGDLFRLMRIPILRGRTFTRVESEIGAPVVVVTEQTARLLFPGEDALGKTVGVERHNNTRGRQPLHRQARVIGICRDFVSRATDGGPRPSIHFPDTFRPGTVAVVRGKGSPEDTARQFEAALARAPGALVGARIANMEETIIWETYPQQAASWLSSLLGVVALLLTATGMYGVMTYMTAQRTKEIGIRMALGATRAQVARHLLSYSAKLAGVGLLFGVVLAIGGLQYTGSVINVSIGLLDVPAYVLSFTIVLGAALLAVTGPARRASNVDPLEALRAD